MRWATFLAPGSPAPRTGLVDGEYLRALPAGTSLIDLLGDDGQLLQDAADRARSDPADVLALSGVRLLPPLRRPPSVRDFMSFRQHVEGLYRPQGIEVPAPWSEHPVFYFTNPRALVGAADPVPVPPGCLALDFELEVAAVLGRDGADVTAEQAADLIAGFCILNDWSARDVQMREMEMRLGPAKGKDSATTLGPWLVTKDELAAFRTGPGYDLEMKVAVNGAHIGADRWSNISWSFEEMIAYAARGTTVSAGDVFGSGTCGSGCLAELRLRPGGEARHEWLRAGDVVSMQIDGLGSIENQIVPGPALVPLATAAR
jgi:2-keto-4-pentenoate hydratase/2-oxohepta-3-ene-1,7-dioic acid hydratase in catechol pathway